MSKTIWLTGLPGSGKTTIARALKKEEPNFIILNGSCEENAIKRCKSLNSNNKKVIATFITPLETTREKIKKEINDCKIVFLSCSHVVCRERRSEKYKKEDYSNFEFARCADLIIDTELNTIKMCINEIFEEVYKE